MVMAKPRATLSTPDRQTVLWIFRLRRMKVLFEIRDHVITGISVCPKESMIIANAIQTLPYGLLRKTFTFIFGGEGLNRAFF